MQSRPIVAAIALTWSLAAGGPALAQTTGQQPTKPGNNPMKPEKTCEISASGVDFGVYDTLGGAPTDATGSLTYICSHSGGATSIIITIDQGHSGSFDRAMAGPGADELKYNLYLDVGRTEMWGDGSAGTQVFHDKVPASGKLHTATVFGRLTPRQHVGAGRYTDSLVVTLQF